MTEEPKYIYLTIKDIDPEAEEEYEQWMKEEHIPDLLGVPGVKRGLKFVACDGSSPKHMIFYELENSDIPLGEAWGKAAHTERSKYMSAHWNGKAKNIFKLVGVFENKK